jgi:hypothetical protein
MYQSLVWPCRVREKLSDIRRDLNRRMSCKFGKLKSDHPTLAILEIDAVPGRTSKLRCAW